MGEPNLREVPDAAKSESTQFKVAPQVNRQSNSIAKLVVLMVLGAAVCALFLFTSAKDFAASFFNTETTDDAFIGAPIATLSSRIGGTVTEVLFEDHAKVKKGALLARIDSREYKIKVTQIETELAAAQTAYAAAKRFMDRGDFENLVKRRESDLQSAILEEAKNVGPTEELRARRQSAHRAQLKEALFSAERERDQANERYESAISKYWVLKSQLEQAKLNLEYTEIRAPADGVIGKRQIEPGMVIKPSQIVTTLVDDSKRWVVANFKETQLRSIKARQEVEIKVDAIKNVTFNGLVYSVAPASGATFAVIPPDNATGNFIKVVQRVSVKIELKPEAIRGFEDQIRPGLSAFVKVHVRK